jgi:hypothetical protein
MTDIEICQCDMLYPLPTPEHAARRGACPKTTSDQGAARVDRPVQKTPGFTTMTSELLYFAGQFQLWVNQLVARHLEAEAAKFVR